MVRRFGSVRDETLPSHDFREFLACSKAYGWMSSVVLTLLVRFGLQRSGELVPKRQKTFVSVLANSISTSLGTGSSCITFSKDSTKLFLSSAFGASVAVVELTEGVDEEFEVVAVFGEGEKEFEQKQKKLRGSNGVNGNGGDVEMNGDASNDDSDDDESVGAPKSHTSTRSGTSSIVALSTSQDGKWLATAALDRTVEIYDLSTRKVSLRLSLRSSVAILLTDPVD